MEDRTTSNHKTSTSNAGMAEGDKHSNMVKIITIMMILM